MSVFNWGIYAGIGIAFPIGRYITEANLWELVSTHQNLEVDTDVKNVRT